MHLKHQSVTNRKVVNVVLNAVVKDNVGITVMILVTKTATISVNHKKQLMRQKIISRIKLLNLKKNVFKNLKKKRLQNVVNVVIIAKKCV